MKDICQILIIIGLIFVVCVTSFKWCIIILINV